jgi:hypothetical protein
LRGIEVSRYTSGGAVHAAPPGAAFRDAFGVGASNDYLAPMDVAAIALASVKALDARVSEISLTPGAKGDTGAAASSATAATVARIAALEKVNRRLTRLLATLQRQVAVLEKESRTASLRGGAPQRRANGRP